MMMSVDSGLVTLLSFKARRVTQVVAIPALTGSASCRSFSLAETGSVLNSSRCGAVGLTPRHGTQAVRAVFVGERNGDQCHRLALPESARPKTDRRRPAPLT